MKLISLIWILSMLLLGLATAGDMTPNGPDTAMELCSLDNCCGHGGCCLPEENGGDQDLPDEEEGCGDDCQCDVTLQFMAVYLPDDEGRTRGSGQASYGSYVNQYHFEYPKLLFQPPRLM